jgi:hypothetical protein
MFGNTTAPAASSGFESTGVMSTQPSGDGAAPEATPQSVSPSLLLDLQAYAEDPASAELLPLVAASAKHGKPLALALELDERALPLSLHPQRQIYICSVDLCALPDEALARVRLLRIESGVDGAAVPAGRQHIGSLRPLLWHLAMRGAHTRLLPDIAGPVRCRIALGSPLSGLPVDGATKRLIQAMKAAPVSIEDLLGQSLMGRSAIQRVWNALYLQSALMVSRTFPH